MSANAVRLAASRGAATEPIRLVFVNHVHPDSGLVAGLRLWRFGQELARRGHRVMLVTERLQADRVRDSAAAVDRLNMHDWSEPLLLPFGEPDDLKRQRSGRRSAKLRFVQKAKTASAIVLRGGVFWRWRKAVEEEIAPLVQAFQPQLVYATFGNLDALNIARGLARRGGIPWVMDVKDSLRAFVPLPFWKLVRARYSDAAAVTFNSEYQRSVSAPLLGRDGDVIYSGADIAEPHHATSEGLGGEKQPFFTLIGSLYSDDYAESLLRTFGDFAAQQRHKDLPEPRLRYFGGDHERVRRLVTQLGSPRGISVHERIPRPELLGTCRTARANCYLSSKRGFHHKLFELLAAGRPVIAYPSEWPESVAVAQRVGAKFEVCVTPKQLIDAWTRAADDWDLAPAPAIAVALGWGRFAGELERLFENLVNQRKVNTRAPAGDAPA